MTTYDADTHTQTLTAEWSDQPPLTVDGLVPTRSLRQKLGQVHVGESDETVTALVREQIAKVRADERVADRGNWTAALIEQTCAAALFIHHENRAMYGCAMSGRF